MVPYPMLIGEVRSDQVWSGQVRSGQDNKFRASFYITTVKGASWRPVLHLFLNIHFEL